VGTPKAAAVSVAVAAITVGFVGALHAGKNGILTIGAQSKTFAAAWPAIFTVGTNTARLTGGTGAAATAATGTFGALAAIVHAILSPFTTGNPIKIPPKTCMNCYSCFT
jgi:hypothetical protein